MSKYIDVKQANAHLLTCLAKYPSSFSFGLMSAVHEICALPTADVVEVVRCKDCKYYRSWGDCITCQHWTLFEDVSTDPNAFCSYGERGEEE